MDENEQNILSSEDMSTLDLPSLIPDEINIYQQSTEKILNKDKVNDLIFNLDDIEDIIKNTDAELNTLVNLDDFSQVCQNNAKNLDVLDDFTLPIQERCDKCENTDAKVDNIDESSKMTDDALLSNNEDEKLIDFEKLINFVNIFDDGGGYIVTTNSNKDLNVMNDVSQNTADIQRYDKLCSNLIDNIPKTDLTDITLLESNVVVYNSEMEVKNSETITCSNSEVSCSSKTEANFNESEYTEAMNDTDFKQHENSVKSSNEMTDQNSTTVECGSINYLTSFKEDGLQPKREKDNLDTIYKSSTECDDLGNTSDNSDGYHSSDFEFITESEAVKEGLIINDNGRKTSPKIKPENVDLNTASSRKFAEREPLIMGMLTYDNGRTFRNPMFEESVDYRQQYVTRGEAYLNLFQGYYDPRFENVRDFHNKICDIPFNRPDRVAAMSTRSGHDSFDKPVSTHGSDDEENLETVRLADITEQNILSRYPVENATKRKRRL